MIRHDVRAAVLFRCTNRTLYTQYNVYMVLRGISTRDHGSGLRNTVRLVGWGVCFTKNWTGFYRRQSVSKDVFICFSTCLGVFFTQRHVLIKWCVLAQNKRTIYINDLHKRSLVYNRAATVQMFFRFGSVLIFVDSFRLFRFGSSNCILFVFHNQNMYS